MKEMQQDFFGQDTCAVARLLLGQYLVAGEQAYLITETEAYDGMSDQACHASKGKTPRTAAMFGPPGHLYVYLIYGMYWMLNVVTREEDFPAAVLIRGVYDEIHDIHYDGPGKLTKALGISDVYHTRPAISETGVWFAYSGREVSSHDILRTPRIGVSSAGAEWANKPYRFVLQSF